MKKSLLLALLLSLLPLAQVQASCVCPEGGPLEVVPGNGAQGVPLDARIWVFGGLCGELVKVVLDGTEFTDIQKVGAAYGVFSLDPGDLEPSSSHEFTLVFSGEGFDGEESFGPYQFTTGLQAAGAPENPVLSGLAGEILPDLFDPLAGDDRCLELLRRQDCYDTGAFGLFGAQNAAAEPALYLVQRVQPGDALKDDSKATPILGSCGPLTIGGTAEGEVGSDIPLAEDFCLQVRAYNVAGSAAEATVICGAPAETEDSDSGGGCSVGGGPGGAMPLLLLLLAGLVMGRRRSGAA